MALTGVASFIRVFQSERVQYFREASGLSQPKHTMMYIIGKDLSFIYTFLLGPFLFLLVLSAFTTPLSPLYRLYFPAAAVYYAAAGYAYMIGLVFPASAAHLVGIVTIFGISMMSGGITHLSDLMQLVVPLRYFPHFSFMRYGLESLYVAEAQEWKRLLACMGTDYDAFMLAQYNYKVENYLQNVLVTIAFGFLFRTLTIMIMSIKDQSKKM
jgi:hypothetical protein